MKKPCSKCAARRKAIASAAKGVWQRLPTPLIKPISAKITGHFVPTKGKPK